MTESVQNIQKKTLLDNSQCNKVNKDNLKNKGKHTFDGIEMCGVAKLCLLYSYLPKKTGLLIASFRILGRFFQIFFTWIIGGRDRQRYTHGSFQCGASYCFG